MTERLPPNEYASTEYAPIKYRNKKELEAVITEQSVQYGHELAAAALDAFVEEIIERVRKIEAIKEQAVEQLAACRELAERYRDAGKLMSAQIEMTQVDLTETRQVIEKLRSKITSTLM